MKPDAPLILLLGPKSGADSLKRLAGLLCDRRGESLSIETEVDPMSSSAVSQAAEAVRAEIGDGHPQHLMTAWSDDPIVTGFHALLARELGAAAIVAKLKEDCCEFRRLVLATGGGTHSLHGLKLGKCLAASLNVESKVVRVIRPGSQANDPDQLALHTMQVHDALEMQCHLLGIKAPLVVKSRDDVVGAIIEEADEHDLIVIGGTNDWRISRHLQGSIPEEVARRANCSVLMHFSPPRQELALNDVFWERTTVPNLRVPEKWAAISTLVDALVADKQIPPDEKETVLKTVFEREKEESTATGRGIAIPHAPLPGFRGTVGALGLCRAGIPGWSKTKDPVQLVFMLVTAADDYANYLGVLSRIARLITDESAKKRLLNSRTAADLMLTMEEFEGTSLEG